MLTKLTIRNFKKFQDVEIELGNTVVFVGPNDSGKTTALQALALWSIGLARWNEKRSGKVTPEKRPGVTINRRDLIALPIPEANLLWRNLHVRDVQRTNGTPDTKNVRVDIIVEGITHDKLWTCGLEFDYANEQSFYCRPLRLSEGDKPERMSVPLEASEVRLAFLQPMSGLAAEEPRHDPGRISVLLGEGRTAEVLRNLCYQILTEKTGEERWEGIRKRMADLFGVVLDDPIYIPERGEITMSYRNRAGSRLDISSAGRGLQQTLLLLAHLAVNPRSVLLLDEPDAHLEILRQRQTYELLTDSATEQNSQLIIASHSEVILNEAADRDIVVAFVGSPHRIDDRGSQVLKSLKEIGFDHYYQAEQTGWVLYLEGSSDLAILRAFAELLGHPSRTALERPFVHYVLNQPSKAKSHFYGLREAKPNLVGFALYDRLEHELENRPELNERMWRRREIENYLASVETLLRYADLSAKEAAGGPLFDRAEQDKRRRVMENCIEDYVPRAAFRDESDRWWVETKASDDFLDRLFEAFFSELNLPNLMRKSDYHLLARCVPPEKVDPEVVEVLDRMLALSQQARPIPTSD